MIETRALVLEGDLGAWFSLEHEAHVVSAGVLDVLAIDRDERVSDAHARIECIALKRIDNADVGLIVALSVLVFGDHQSNTSIISDGLRAHHLCSLHVLEFGVRIQGAQHRLEAGFGQLIQVDGLDVQVLQVSQDLSEEFGLFLDLLHGGVRLRWAILLLLSCRRRGGLCRSSSRRNVPRQRERQHDRQARGGAPSALQERVRRRVLSRHHGVRPGATGPRQDGHGIARPQSGKACAPDRKLARPERML